MKHMFERYALWIILAIGLFPWLGGMGMAEQGALQLSVQLDKSEYRWGEQIWITSTLRNTGAEAIEAFRPESSAVTYEVRNAATGAVIPHQIKYSWIASTERVRMEAGAQLKDTDGLLSDGMGYGFLAQVPPGQFLLTARYAIEEFDIASQPVPFAVLEPTERDKEAFKPYLELFKKLDQPGVEAARAFVAQFPESHYAFRAQVYQGQMLERVDRDPDAAFHWLRILEADLHPRQESLIRSVLAKDFYRLGLLKEAIRHMRLVDTWWGRIDVRNWEEELAAKRAG